MLLISQSSQTDKDHHALSPPKSTQDTSECVSPRDAESSATSQTSGLDLTSLDAKMQEIEDSLQEMDSTATPTPGQDPEDDEEDEDEDSDSEDEEEGGKGKKEQTNKLTILVVNRCWVEDWC